MANTAALEAEVTRWGPGPCAVEARLDGHLFAPLALTLALSAGSPPRAEGWIAGHGASVRLTLTPQTLVLEAVTARGVGHGLRLEIPVALGDPRAAALDRVRTLVASLPAPSVERDLAEVLLPWAVQTVGQEDPGRWRRLQSALGALLREALADAGEAALLGILDEATARLQGALAVEQGPPGSGALRAERRPGDPGLGTHPYLGSSSNPFPSELGQAPRVGALPTLDAERRARLTAALEAVEAHRRAPRADPDALLAQLERDNPGRVKDAAEALGAMGVAGQPAPTDPAALLAARAAAWRWGAAAVGVLLLDDAPEAARLEALEVLCAPLRPRLDPAARPLLAGPAATPKDAAAQLAPLLGPTWGATLDARLQEAFAGWRLPPLQGEDLAPLRPPVTPPEHRAWGTALGTPPPPALGPALADVLAGDPAALAHLGRALGLWQRLRIQALERWLTDVVVPGLVAAIPASDVADLEAEQAAQREARKAGRAARQDAVDRARAALEAAEARVPEALAARTLRAEEAIAALHLRDLGDALLRELSDDLDELPPGPRQAARGALKGVAPTWARALAEADPLSRAVLIEELEEAPTPGALRVSLTDDMEGLALAALNDPLPEALARALTPQDVARVAGDLALDRARGALERLVEADQDRQRAQAARAAAEAALRAAERSAASQDLDEIGIAASWPAEITVAATPLQGGGLALSWTPLPPGTPLRLTLNGTPLRPSGARLTLPPDHAALKPGLNLVELRALSPRGVAVQARAGALGPF
ncbi:MAG: hypothetical protein H6739_09375 [Alphaproteobacteria bacterium]|nr:hypothetical protein [Alphaproteobacteria bacterium]